MTEPKRHPHADVLIAIAEGRTVQFRHHDSLDWEDADDCFDAAVQWRVKPQKMKRWLNVYERTVHDYESREQADADALSDRIACIEIEFEEGEGL